MGAEEPKFSEAQVAAMSASAVQQETAALRTEVEQLKTDKAAADGEKAALADQLATVEAEKAELLTQVETAQAATLAAESARDAVQGEFDTFKTELTEMAATSTRRTERVERIKAAAPHLTDEFLADEARQTRWTEMSDDQFGSLLEGFVESAAAALTPAERESVEKAADKNAAIATILSNRRGPAADAKTLRETAAFQGGSEPGAGAGGQSKLVSFLNQRTGTPARISA